MPPFDDVHLYVILDMGILMRLNRDAVDIMTAAYNGGASMFQFRYKDILEGELFEQAKRLISVARRLKAPFIVNDSLAVAMAIGADGVHLGGNDLPVDSARTIAGSEFIIGASANSFARAVEMENRGADYIGYGAMFPTGTKDDTSVGTIDELRKIIQTVKVPVFPLGGINSANVEKISEIGCTRACVASGIIAVENPGQTASKIISVLKKTKLEE